MIKVIHYDTNGKILSINTGPESFFKNLSPVVKTELDFLCDDVTHYIHNGEIANRPENPSTLNGATINSVPPSSTVRIDGVEYEAKEGGDIELRFNQIGVYKIEIESFPYLDKESTIDYQP